MAFRKLPAGVQDILPPECRILNEIRERLAQAFEQNGYDPVLSAAVDYYDTYAQTKNALPEERMFKFTDGDGKLLALRPDATLSISRIAATKLEGRARLYYFANKWDAQNAGGLKSREIIQAGVERLGESGAFSDAQTVAFAIDCTRAAGLRSPIVEIGHVGYFKGLLEDSGLSAAQAEEVRAHINAKDGLNAERVLVQAGAGRDTLDAVRMLPALFGGAEVFDRAEALTANKTARAAVAHVREVGRILADMGYEQNICFDFGTVNYRDPRTFPSFNQNLHATLYAVYDFLEDCCDVRRILSLCRNREDSGSWGIEGRAMHRYALYCHKPFVESFRESFHPFPDAFKVADSICYSMLESYKSWKILRSCTQPLRDCGWYILIVALRACPSCKKWRDSLGYIPADYNATSALGAEEALVPCEAYSCRVELFHVYIDVRRGLSCIDDEWNAMRFCYLSSLRYILDRP